MPQSHLMKQNHTKPCNEPSFDLCCRCMGTYAHNHMPVALQLVAVLMQRPAGCPGPRWTLMDVTMVGVLARSTIHIRTNNTTKKKTIKAERCDGNDDNDDDSCLNGLLRIWIIVRCQVLFQNEATSSFFIHAKTIKWSQQGLKAS